MAEWEWCLIRKELETLDVNDFATTPGCRGGQTKLESAPAAYADKKILPGTLKVPQRTTINRRGTFDLFSCCNREGGDGTTSHRPPP